MHRVVITAAVMVVVASGVGCAGPILFTAAVPVKIIVGDPAIEIDGLKDAPGYRYNDDLIKDSDAVYRPWMNGPHLVVNTASNTNVDESWAGTVVAVKSGQAKMYVKHKLNSRWYEMTGDALTKMRQHEYPSRHTEKTDVFMHFDGAALAYGLVYYDHDDAGNLKLDTVQRHYKLNPDDIWRVGQP